ncbi:MAG TPA: ROK family protein [bacterium]|nr:ROK family protein [bacterium]
MSGAATGSALAVDLGGTKLLVGIVDRDGRVLARQRIATPQGGPDAVARAIGDLARALSGANGMAGTSGVGVAVPGPTDHDHGVIYDPPNLTGWGQQTAFGPILARTLGTPVFVENDANAAALGEAWVGAGQGVRDLIYITVSTGIGGGVILDGQLHRGADGTAGEFGHVIVEPQGPQCHCGNRGCLEALASGTAIARQAREAVARGARSTLQNLAAHPEEITAQSVADAALGGDPLAADLYRRAGTYVGTFLGNLLAILNPAMIIVGGGVSKTGDLLFQPLRAAIAARVYPKPALHVTVVPADLGDDVGIIGAAALVFHGASERARRPT